MSQVSQTDFNRSSYYSQSEVDILMDGLNKDIDLVWMLVCSIFIFLMQMGFAMLEAGTVRTKNSSNILLKNMLDTYYFFKLYSGAISYYLVGYGLANNAQGGLLGKAAFASHNFTQKDFLDWIFQYSVCSNITTIVAGSLAERTFVDTYMFFAMLMTSIIYPIVASWTIGGGWLSLLGFIDFAGAAYYINETFQQSLIILLTIRASIGRVLWIYRDYYFRTKIGHLWLNSIFIKYNFK